jgi:hypothetical protein
VERDYLDRAEPDDVALDDGSSRPSDGLRPVEPACVILFSGSGFEKETWMWNGTT